MIPALWLTRLEKLRYSFSSPRLLKALLRYQVLAGAEHRTVLHQGWQTVVDIGANRGQFALAARHWAPRARIFSFEPLAGPAAIHRSVFAGDEKVTLYESAIGPHKEKSVMHVSARDDSSSLLPITKAQTDMFPGTHEVATAEVTVGPLDAFVPSALIQSPALLKIDVQGFEYSVLCGCEPLLQSFDMIYCECSFVELYKGQRLAPEIVKWLSQRGFHVQQMLNTAYDKNGNTVQADFLFSSRRITSPDQAVTPA